MATMPRIKRPAAIVVLAVGGLLLVMRLLSLASADAATEPALAEAGREPAAAVPRPATRAPADTALPVLRLDRLAAEAPQDSAAPAGPGPFAPLVVATRAAPPPVAPPPPAPVRPVAPPFPYTYIGAITEDRVRTAWFGQGDRVILVRAGDTVDATYRVEALGEQEVRFVYLPLNEPVRLALGTPR